MANPESLSDLVREILDEPPLNQCADEGTYCVFCGAEWSDVRAFLGREPAITHDADCWINRAQKAIHGGTSSESC